MFINTLNLKAIQKWAVQIVLFYEMQQHAGTIENSPGTYVLEI